MRVVPLERKLVHALTLGLILVASCTAPPDGASPPSPGRPTVAEAPTSASPDAPEAATPAAGGSGGPGPTPDAGCDDGGDSGDSGDSGTATSTALPGGVPQGDAVIEATLVRVKRYGCQNTAMTLRSTSTIWKAERVVYADGEIVVVPAVPSRLIVGGGGQVARGVRLPARVVVWITYVDVIDRYPWHAEMALRAPSLRPLPSLTSFFRASTNDVSKLYRTSEGTRAERLEAQIEYHAEQNAALNARNLGREAPETPRSDFLRRRLRRSR